MIEITDNVLGKYCVSVPTGSGDDLKVVGYYSTLEAADECLKKIFPNGYIRPILPEERK